MKDHKAVLLIQKMWRSKLSRRRYARWADIRKGRATPSEEKGAVAMQRSYRGFSARLKAQAASGHALLRGRGPGVPVDVVRDGQALDELLLQVLGSSSAARLLGSAAPQPHRQWPAYCCYSAVAGSSGLP